MPADAQLLSYNPAWPVRCVMHASRTVLRIERWVLASLMFALVALVLLNVITRYARMPIYWVDEASVYAMVWLTFVGASIMTRLRMDFAVTMLTDKLQPTAAKWVRLVATASVLGFGLALVAMCFLWMDPIGLARYGFDVREYAAQTFNFLYTERTQTLEWPVWALQMVMPFFAVSMSLHSAANLLEDLALAPRARFPEFPVTNPDLVN